MAKAMTRVEQALSAAPGTARAKGFTPDAVRAGLAEVTAQLRAKTATLSNTSVLDNELAQLGQLDAALARLQEQETAPEETA